VLPLAWLAAVLMSSNGRHDMTLATASNLSSRNTACYKQSWSLNEDFSTAEII
jgi:hypothetical protein